MRDEDWETDGRFKGERGRGFRRLSWVELSTWQDADPLNQIRG